VDHRDCTSHKRKCPRYFILFYFFASREYNAVCADGFDPLGFFQDTQSSQKENVEVIAVFSPPKFLGGHRCATE
jgi:hypothetical protein